MQPLYVPLYIERLAVHGVLHLVINFHLTRFGSNGIGVGRLDNRRCRSHLRVVATTREAQSENREKRQQKKR